VLPPGEFNGKMSEQLAVYESFMTTVITVFPYFVVVTNIITSTGD